MSWKDFLAYFDSRVIRAAHASLRPAPCAACGSTRTALAGRFGTVALSGGFRHPTDEEELTYPLDLLACHDCGALAVEEQVPQEVLFGSYFFRTSTSRTTVQHMRQLAWILHQQFAPRSALEVGCNDGVLLSALADYGVACIGVDPAACCGRVQDHRLTIIPDYFTRKTVACKVDLVVANNVLAHVPEPVELMRAIAAALEPGGVVVFELHDLQAMLDGAQWDWVYHEHRYYYGPRAVQKLVERAGLQLFEAQPIQAHNGSIRYYAGHPGKHKVSEWVSAALDSERSPVTTARTVGRLRRQMLGISGNLRQQVARLRAGGKTVAGYGASGRGAMILQHSGAELAYVVDDTPGKQGLMMPGTFVPIVGPGALRTTPPDVLVVLAWPYWNEIEARLAEIGWKGELINPMVSPG